MNFFIDMCILVFYSDIDSPKNSKVSELISKKAENQIFICYYILNENLPKWIERQKVILEEVVRKVRDAHYKVGISDKAKKMLYPRDLAKIQKLLAVYSLSADKTNFCEILAKNQIALFQRINFFLNKVVDKKVIPVLNIDPELKSAIFTFTNNHSDAMTLASGIQYNKEEKLILLTGDKKDWTKSNLEWAVPEHSPLRKKYPDLPSIQYI